MMASVLSDTFMKKIDRVFKKLEGSHSIVTGRVEKPANRVPVVVPVVEKVSEKDVCLRWPGLRYRCGQ